MDDLPRPDDVARGLYRVGAVRVETGTGFRLAIHERHPGAPRSPFYIDLRLLRSFPKLIHDVARLMTEDGWRAGVWGYADLISDVPTAATPIVTLISQVVRIPMISPRLAAKGHGADGSVIGVWAPGQRVVVVDDLRTTGGSKEEVIGLLAQHGLQPKAVLVLVDRGSPEGAPVADLPFFSVFRWSWLLAFYRRARVISEADFERCERYPELLTQHIAACSGCVASER